MANRGQGTSVERYYSRKRQQKKRKVRRFYFFLTLVAIVTFIVLSLTVFFNIRSFQVEGNVTYTAQQIISAAGMKEGDNLFRMNKFKVEERLLDALPYVGTVEIYRKLPTTLCITVTETKAELYVADGNGFVLLDRDLKMLDHVSEITEDMNLVELRGDTLTEYKVGERAVFSGGSESYLASLCASIEEHLTLSKTDAINLESKFDLDIYYGDGQIKILLGSLEKAAEKLEMVGYVMEKNEGSERARIDITNGTTAYYQPISADEELDEVEEVPPETEASDDAETTVSTDENASEDTENQ